MEPSQPLSPVTLDQHTYIELPQGKMATTVTYLEQLSPCPPLAESEFREVPVLQRLKSGDIERYIRLFRAVGEEYLWSLRLRLEKEKLERLMDEEFRFVYAVHRAGKDVGILELSFEKVAEDGTAELAFCGLVQEAIGTGVSRWLMNTALSQVWNTKGVTRVFLSTTSFDHPAAIKYYRKHGFRPCKLGLRLRMIRGCWGCCQRRRPQVLCCWSRTELRRIYKRSSHIKEHIQKSKKQRKSPINSSKRPYLPTTSRSPPAPRQP
jgi:GNAT superfamily N-acetyltransferase